MIVACRKSSGRFSDVLNIKYAIWEMSDSFWSLWWMFTRNHWPLPHLKWNQIGSFTEKAKTDLWSSVFNLSSLYTFHLAWAHKAIFFSQFGEKWPLSAVQWVCTYGNIFVGKQGQWIVRKVFHPHFFPFPHFHSTLFFFHAKTGKNPPQLFVYFKGILSPENILMRPVSFPEFFCNRNFI